MLYPKPEPAARLAALQSGEVDWAEVIPPDSIEQIKAAGYNVLLKTYPHTIYYGFNTYRAPFNDVRVRQAVAYGIDRVGIVSIIQGAGKPATQLMYEGHPWRDPTFKGYDVQPAEGEGAAHAGRRADPEDQRRLPDRWLWEHVARSDEREVPAGHACDRHRGRSRAAGVEYAPDAVPRRPRQSRLREVRRVLVLTEHAGAAPRVLQLPHRAHPAGRLLQCDGLQQPERGRDCLRRPRASSTRRKQDKLLAEFQGTMIREAPIAPVVHDLNLRVLSPKVRGWVQPQSWWGDFRSVWMKD